MNLRTAEFTEIPIPPLCDIELAMFINTYIDKAEYQVQYQEKSWYWTPPLPLTRERAETLKTDTTIARVRFIMASNINKD